MGFAIFVVGILGIGMIVRSESPVRVAAVQMIKGDRREQRGLFYHLVQRVFPDTYIKRIREDVEICKLQEDTVIWLSNRVMTGFVVLAIFLLLGFVLLNPLIGVVGILGAWLAYSVPLYRLRANGNSLRFNIEKDVNFMTTYITQMMLAGVTPYDAVLSACKQVPKYLENDINRLKTDLVTTGEVGQHFSRFAERIQSKSARRFAVLLEQLELSGDINSIDILLHQNDVAEKDKKALFTREIQKLPTTLMWPNLIMFANMVGLPVIIVGSVILKMFTSF